MQLLQKLSFLGLIFTIGGLVACQGSDLPGAEPVAERPDQITIGTGFDEAWGPIEERIIAAYEAQNNNVAVARLPLEADWPENVAASPPADILLGVANEGFRDAAARDGLLNLDLIWRDSNLSENIPPAIQATTVTAKGQYMLPMSVSWAAIYYNRDVFAVAGLQPPETWAELLDACALLIEQGERPFASGPPAWVGRLWFDMINLRLNGADYHRALQLGEIGYDDPGVAEVFDYWAQLLNQGCFGESYHTGASNNDSLTAVVRDEQGLLSRNNAAMTLVNSFQMADLPEVFFDQYDFFRFPLINPEIPVAEIIWPIGYGVPSDAANVAEAMDFMGFAASADAQTIVAQGLGPFAVPGSFAVADAELSAAQAAAVALIGAAEEGVLSQFLVSGFSTFQRTDLAFATFLRQPERYLDTIEMLEEIRRDQIDGE